MKDSDVKEGDFYLEMKTRVDGKITVCSVTGKDFKDLETFNKIYDFCQSTEVMGERIDFTTGKPMID